MITTGKAGLQAGMGQQQQNQWVFFAGMDANWI